MGIDQPKVSALLNGRLANFSSERLMRLLTALGHDVDIIVVRSTAIARIDVGWAKRSVPTNPYPSALGSRRYRERCRGQRRSRRCPPYAFPPWSGPDGGVLRATHPAA